MSRRVLPLIPAGPSVVQVLSGWQLLPDHGSLSAMVHAPDPYRGFRYPAEVIQHAVWLCHCFSLSLCDVETILAARHCGQLRKHPRVELALWSAVRERAEVNLHRFGGHPEARFELEVFAGSAGNRVARVKAAALHGGT